MGEVSFIRARQPFCPLACGIARLEILMYQRRHLREQRRLSEHVLLKLADVALDEDVEAAEPALGWGLRSAELNQTDQRVVELLIPPNPS